MKSYLFSLILSLYAPQEINVANSIDWLCYNSGTVATVTITSAKEEKFTLMGYESDVTVNAKVQTIYKGSIPQRNEIIIYSRLGYIGNDKWVNMVDKEVLVFLKDMICESQCAYTIWDDDRGMINLESPGTKAIAGDFSVLETKNEIFRYGVDRIEKLRGKTAQQHYLEVPYKTEAYGALYSGSSCFLIVPDILYPESTRGMH